MTALTAFKLGFYFAAGGLLGLFMMGIIIVGITALLLHLVDGDDDEVDGVLELSRSRGDRRHG